MLEGTSDPRKVKGGGNIRGEGGYKECQSIMEKIKVTNKSNKKNIIENM